MSRIKITDTRFEGLKIIEPFKIGDARGYFSETYNCRDLKSNGVDIQFVQDNQSKSAHGVMRGLHFQNAPYAQTKMVRVLSGEILDVVVDLRRDQPTFGESFRLKMSSDNGLQILVPKGFAHGFVVLSEGAEILYKTDEYHYPESEGGIMFNDLDLAIDWVIPEKDMIISERDKKHPRLKDGKFNF